MVWTMFQSSSCKENVGSKIQRMGEVSYVLCRGPAIDGASWLVKTLIDSMVLMQKVINLRLIYVESYKSAFDTNNEFISATALELRVENPVCLYLFLI